VPVELAGETLAKSELALAARLSSPLERRRYLASHLALRCIVAEYFNVPPARIDFAAGPGGKPALSAAADACFNLSHSGGHALVALAHRRHVGVDVERVRSVDVDELAPVATTSQEQRDLRRCDDVDRAYAFLRLWTLKEAVLKARGVGLARDPTTVDVGAALAFRSPGWLWVDGTWACELKLRAGYVGAVAVCGEPAAIDLRQWAPRLPVESRRAGARHRSDCDAIDRGEAQMRSALSPRLPGQRRRLASPR
jgi:4'-phosphopantetheinyl transferase